MATVESQCVCCNSLSISRSPAVLMPFVAHRVFRWEPTEINDEWNLRTIKNGNAYSLCNTLMCHNCYHLFLDIRFNKYEMDNLYKGYRDEVYVTMREKYEPGYKKRNDVLNKGYDYLGEVEGFLTQNLDSIKNLSILDWGGDTGKNTPFCNNESNSIHIYDISNKDTLNGVKRVNLNEAKDNKYDLIVCSNVLEHVPYPQDFMLEIKECMNNSTLLYIEVPYENHIREFSNLDDRLNKKKHWHEHINFFNDVSLKKVFENCGYSVLEMKELLIPNSDNVHVFQIALVLA